MSPALVIVGAGGHGREVLDVAEAVLAAHPGSFDLLGVADDGDGPFPLLDQRGVAHLGPVEALRDLDAAYALGVGDGGRRSALDATLTAWGRQPCSLVHPLASVGTDVTLGPGAMLAAGARVTTHVVTGRHVHLNVNASLSHDCTAGDHVTLNPGAVVAGTVQLGAGCTIGAGAVVRQGLSIGAGATVGAGAAVVADVAPGTTVVGVPARPLDGR